MNRRTVTRERWVHAAALALFVVALIRTAWVCDDAYITFRTVDNLVNGHGLTWNVLERVQVYTHPLWMWLMSVFYATTGDVFFTSIAVSIGLSAVAVAGFAALAGSWGAALAGVLIFTFSKAFVDFSTSGMENALTHALLAAFVWLHLRSQGTPWSLARLALVSALVMLNRLDAALLVAPVLLIRVWRLRSSRAALPLLFGFLPLIAWEVFSLVYYGALVPNTAFAKLSTGIPSGLLAAQGVRYFIDSFLSDPITLVVIAAALVATVRARRESDLALAAGVVAYLLYVVKIGGDFMSGRFFTAPLFVAVVLLARAVGTHWWSTARAGGVAVALVILGCLGADIPVLTGRDYGVGELRVRDGIEDARAYYYKAASLLNAGAGPMPARDTADIGRQLRQYSETLRPGSLAYVNRSSIGYLGFFAGPRVHVIDQYGLADPLLARLPVPDREEWRVGHFKRPLPGGYEVSLKARDNRLTDRDLSPVYEAVRVVVRAPLTTPGRWGYIWALNTGRYDRQIEAYATRHVAP